jgi:polyphosphate kinase
MTEQDKFNRPELFINRELSWLEFNSRVLEQASDKSLPLLERLKFTAIFASNLDEFFMIRVSGLKQQYQVRIIKKDPSGLTPKKQLSAINSKVRHLLERHNKILSEILGLLAEAGLELLISRKFDTPRQKWLSEYFKNSVMPVLSPLAVSDELPMPFLPGNRLNIIITLKQSCDYPEIEDSRQCTHIIIPVPTCCERFIALPNGGAGTSIALLEEIIACNCSFFIDEDKIKSVNIFRVTRDADVYIQDDEADDLLNVVETAVRSRSRRNPVRLEIDTGASKETIDFLSQKLDITADDVYLSSGVIASSELMELCFMPKFDELRIPDWHSAFPIDLVEHADIWQSLREKDVLLMHPYETFEPVVEFLEKASDDPQVLAIKQTLYRTSDDSPIIEALQKAAENGKQVTVLVELKARFDESRNVQWAKRLEKAGCFVIYGVSNLKTHSKALLVVRKEKGRLVQYAHLGTGNYNEKTAKIYSDIGLMTSNKKVTSDVAAFFNLLTGISETVGWSKLSVAPVFLKRKIIELIEKEISIANADRQGFIMMKMNSLQDTDIIKALYKASQNNVKVLLNVRGICCLRPGVEGVSENIEVISIVDRYLEHARIYYFYNCAKPHIYLSSADMMKRNLDKRLEILFPILSDEHKKRVIMALEFYLSDNCNGYKLLSDGSYVKNLGKKTKTRAQEQLHEFFVQSSGHLNRGFLKIKPLKQF